MQHVKSEQCKLGEINDHNNDTRNTNHDINLQRAPPHHQHPPLGYPNHQHMFLNAYPGIKEEMAQESKNLAGIPIPASKPKIWSLADTAACKTPPPNVASGAGGGIAGGPWMNNPHQQLGGRPPSSMIMGGNSSNNCGPNMQSLGGNSMLNNFACSPYSRYGGFLAGTHHQLSNNIGAHSTFMNMVAQQPINHILSNPYNAAQADEHGNNNQINNIRNIHQQQALGFPEIQTDTPPQTPPSQKHPCVATNSILTAAPVSHANVTCFSSNNNNNSSSTNNNNINNTINQNSNTGYSSTSPNPNGYIEN